MLNDISRLAKTGAPMDERGSDGATLVSYHGNQNNQNIKM